MRYTKEQMQFEHVKNRLYTLAESHKKKVRDEHTKPSKELSVKDFLAGVKDGSIKARTKHTDALVVAAPKGRVMATVDTIFDLSAYEMKYDYAAVEAKCNLIDAEMSALEDRLILGDASKMLKALQDFATKKF